MPTRRAAACRASAVAELYGVSRVTVRQALDSMRREGSVRRARGRRGGTFVLSGRERAPTPPSGSFESLFSMRHVRRVETVAHDPRRASEEICAILGLSADSLVAYNERRLVGADGPIAHVRVFMPLEVGARVRRRDLHRRLLQMRDEIRACLADSWAAQTLDVGLGYPLLDVRRALLGPGGAPCTTR